MTSTSDQPPKEYLAEREGPCHAFLRETFTSYDDHIQGGLLGLDKDSDEYQYICTYVLPTHLTWPRFLCFVKQHGSPLRSRAFITATNSIKSCVTGQEQV